MADRVTQLQNEVNLQADNFCNSIGILQQKAQLSPFVGSEKISNVVPEEDYAQLFATIIARTAKDIDVLIDSLPGEEAAPELQARNLQFLEAENNDAACRLQEVVNRGEKLLTQIRTVLFQIGSQEVRSRLRESSSKR